MATVTLLGSTFNTTTGTHTVTAVPAVGDLIVIFVVNTGITSIPTVTDDNNSGTYYQPGSARSLKATSVDSLYVLIRNTFVTSSVSTIFSATGASSTGGGLAVFKITGMAKASQSSLKQGTQQSNQASGGTPTPVFGTAVLTGNPVIGAVFNASNPAAMTPRSSPAYTEVVDTGYATPTTGFEAMTINSGETGTSIAWGGTSGSAFGSSAIELDTSAATATLTGTATASITEADIVAGGKTIILTLTGDTFLNAGANFDGQRQNIINGLDSAQSESTGWDNEVKAKLAVTTVVRTSATVATITLSAQAAYNITATETITATIPSTAVIGNATVVAAPTFTVTPNGGSPVPTGNFFGLF